MIDTLAYSITFDDPDTHFLASQSNFSRLSDARLGGKWLKREKGKAFRVSLLWCYVLGNAKVIQKS